MREREKCGKKDGEGKREMGYRGGKEMGNIIMKQENKF